MSSLEKQQSEVSLKTVSAFRPNQGENNDEREYEKEDISKEMLFSILYLVFSWTLRFFWLETKAFVHLYVILYMFK